VPAIASRLGRAHRPGPAEGHLVLPSGFSSGSCPWQGSSAGFESRCLCRGTRRVHPSPRRVDEPHFIFRFPFPVQLHLSAFSSGCEADQQHTWTVRRACDRARCPGSCRSRPDGLSSEAHCCVNSADFEFAPAAGQIFLIVQILSLVTSPHFLLCSCEEFLVSRSHKGEISAWKFPRSSFPLRHVATHYCGSRCHHRRGGLHANLHPSPQERAAKCLPCSHGQGRRRRALLPRCKGCKGCAGRNYAEQGPGRCHRAALEGEASSLTVAEATRADRAAFTSSFAALTRLCIASPGDLGLL